jgi:prefoldin subunit 5
LDLKNGVESGAVVVKGHEAACHDLAKEIKKLRKELSEQEKMIFKLCMKGIYAFCACM